MKGQMLVSHMIMVSAVLVSLVLVFMVFLDVSNNFRERIIDSVSEKVLSEVDSNIHKIYLTSANSLGGNVSFALLDMPSRIAGKGYTIYFAADEIVLTTGGKNYTRHVNIPCKIYGHAKPPINLVYNSDENVIWVGK